jgi:hypothetical protein
MSRILVAVFCCMCASVVLANDPIPAKPTSHEEHQVEGWTVQVDARLLSGPDAELGEQGLKLLANRLCDIKLVVPAEKVLRLQQVVFWLDRSHGELKSAQYHPSADWLREHGYSEQLAKSVHIPDAANFFFPRHQHEQPWAVMHELAHAYHDQVLDFEHPRVKEAWQEFKATGRYRMVRHISGKQRPHYGLTNQMEFFAEMTESYFGMNDFFPFNAGELEQEEPVVYGLLREIWGPLP